MTDDTVRGVVVPILTPLKPDESVDTSSLRRLVNYLIDGGVHAIILLGSTGEFAKLSMEERKRVLESCVDQVGGRIPVIAGTAAVGMREVIKLS